MIQTRKPGYMLPPGRDRLVRVLAVPGLFGTAAGRECRLLLVHDSVGHEETEAASRDMLAIASGLGLTPGWGSSRSSRRVYLTEGVVMLDYGHDDLALHVTVAGPWYRSAIGTGRIHISVALDPRPDDQCTDAAAHLAAARARGQVWSGVASPRVAIRGPRG